MLEVSGIDAVRRQYWELYNQRRDKIIARAFSGKTPRFNEFENDDPRAKLLDEENLIQVIPEELLAPLQTALMLQLELEIDEEAVFEEIPRILTI